MLYMLLCGYPPFDAGETEDINNLVKIGNFDFETEEWDEISPEGKDLIQNLIIKEDQRLTAE